MTAEERDASILASVAAGRAVLILPDGTDPMLGSLEVALRLLGAGRPDAPEVIVLSALPGDPA